MPEIIGQYTADMADPINVGAQPVAAVYAKALLGAAENAGETEAVLDELESLVRDVLAVHPKFADILSSALIQPEEKIRVLERTLGQQVSPLLMRFLKVLAEHGRLETLKEILRNARQLQDVLRKRHRVQVVTATPLDDALSGHLRDTLRAMLGGEPRFESSVDPDVIGGIVLRVGDTVYDGSVATRLARVREQMINRSVHEIQSRRDRFSHPAGD